MEPNKYFSFFFVSIFFGGWGSHPEVLRIYFGSVLGNSHLAGSVEPMGCWGLNVGLLHADTHLLHADTHLTFCTILLWHLQKKSFVFILGSHLEMFRDYSRLCSQGSFLAVLGDHMECWGSNWDSSMKGKHLSPLCYHSGSTKRNLQRLCNSGRREIAPF